LFLLGLIICGHVAMAIAGFISASTMANEIYSYVLIVFSGFIGLYLSEVCMCALFSVLDFGLKSNIFVCVGVFSVLA
jgi:hypothetical protein